MWIISCRRPWRKCDPAWRTGMLVCDRGPSLATTPDIAAPVTPAWKLGVWKIHFRENNNMFKGENFYRRMEIRWNGILSYQNTYTCRQKMYEWYHVPTFIGNHYLVFYKYQKYWIYSRANNWNWIIKIYYLRGKLFRG